MTIRDKKKKMLSSAEKCFSSARVLLLCSLLLFHTLLEELNFLKLCNSLVVVCLLHLNNVVVNIIPEGKLRLLCIGIIVFSEYVSSQCNSS